MASAGDVPRRGSEKKGARRCWGLRLCDDDVAWQEALANVAEGGGVVG